MKTDEIVITKEMIEAGEAVLEDAEWADCGTVVASATDVYRAMEQVRRRQQSLAESKDAPSPGLSEK